MNQVSTRLKVNIMNMPTIMGSVIRIKDCRIEPSTRLLRLSDFSSLNGAHSLEVAISDDPLVLTSIHGCCRAGDKCAALPGVCRVAVAFSFRVQRDQLNWLRSFNNCFSNFGLANSNSSSAPAKVCRYVCQRVLRPPGERKGAAQSAGRALPQPHCSGLQRPAVCRGWYPLVPGIAFLPVFSNQSGEQGSIESAGFTLIGAFFSSSPVRTRSVWRSIERRYPARGEFFWRTGKSTAAWFILLISMARNPERRETV